MVVVVVVGLLSATLRVRFAGGILRRNVRTGTRPMLLDGVCRNARFTDCDPLSGHSVGDRLLEQLMDAIITAQGSF